MGEIIIDLYHAREHYWNVAHAVLGSDQATLDSWTDQRRQELDQGEVKAVIGAIQRLTRRRKEQKENENIYIDLDASGNLVAMTIEHAQQQASLPCLSYEQIEKTA